MTYELGLDLTIAICAWMFLDWFAKDARRSRNLAHALLAVSPAVWAAGELLIRRSAGDPDWVIAGRRVLYAGAYTLPLAWAWLGASSSRAAWVPPRRRWPLVALAVPLAAAYSCLYWDRSGWFLHWTALPPREGPVFWAAAAYAWLLIALGAAHLVRAARRLGRASPLRMLAVLGGVATPVLGNVLHLLVYGLEGPDPTPVLLAFAVLLVRLGAVEAGLTSFLPVARRDVIEQLRQGVLVADLDDVVVDANPAARGLLRDEGILGRRCQEVLQRGRAASRPALEVESFPVRSGAAEVGRAVILTDRSEARRAERQLLLAGRLEALGVLTAGIAHEVNNPLAYVRTNLGLLDDFVKRVGSPPVAGALPAEVAAGAAEAADVLADARDGVERIGDLVARLRTFARVEDAAPERRAVVVAEAIERAVRLAAVGLPPDAVRVDAPRHLTVWVREGALVQILLNLLVNAVQASARAPDVDVEARAAHGGVRIAVRDRGVGIPEHVLAHVFDPFFTTKPPGQGTGLGLSLSFDLARENGGTLDGENRPGGGAVFELWLPEPPRGSALEAPRASA
jgi:signal transduction histidine kinase